MLRNGGGNNYNSNSQNFIKPLTTLSGLRPSKKKVIGLEHAPTMDSDINSGKVSENRLGNDIVETFYD